MMNGAETERDAPFDPEHDSRNILLTLAYDGTNYLGWQVQPDGVTVQQRVEEAVTALTGEQRRVLCAGRTDTGVHAVGQAASFRTRSRIPVGKFRAGLQSHLPEDIVVVDAKEVSLELHATFSTVRKQYRYVLHDGDVCLPFLRRYVQRSRVRLHAGRMHDAAQCLLGTHDFRCFEKQYPNKFSSVRTVFTATVRRESVWHPWQGAIMAGDSGALAQESPRHPGAPWPHEAPDSPFVVFDIVADGFLYNMVRAIVGTLTDVGRGKRPPEFLADVISSMDRRCAGMTAVPCGLYLMQVDYPEHLLSPR
jgi:tRNA pseudouridine38-40 synthase